MKYKLINIETLEETICDKLTIGGYDYYRIKLDPKIGDSGTFISLDFDDPYIVFLDYLKKEDILHVEYKVIATNNPSVSTPKIIDDEYPGWTDDDIQSAIDFGVELEACGGRDYKTFKTDFDQWKSQYIKTIYYV